MTKPAESFVGERFGRLVVEAVEPKPHTHRGNRGHYFVCACDCGSTHRVRRDSLISGAVVSCGCKKRENRVTDRHRLVSVRIGYYRNNARQRGYVFDLSRESVERLMFSPCHYCGQPASELEPNGIDRQNNQDGYTVANCVPACSRCNVTKWTHHSDEYEDWIVRCADHIQGRGLPSLLSLCKQEVSAWAF